MFASLNEKGKIPSPVFQSFVQMDLNIPSNWA